MERINVDKNYFILFKYYKLQFNETIFRCTALIKLEIENPDIKL